MEHIHSIYIQIKHIYLHCKIRFEVANFKHNTHFNSGVSAEYTINYFINYIFADYTSM